MIAVIITTFNAGADLPRALAPLVAGAASGLVKQVVVADGGSSDDTLAIADSAGCKIVACGKGRGKQMIAGAGAARAPWLLFLHADTALAPGWEEETRRFIAEANETECAAAFRFAFDDESAAARRVEFWARLRGAWLKLPYGDQGLLISRTFYDAVGGFRDLALMEDVDLVRRIGPARLQILRAEAVTSAAKYRRDGFERRAWRNLFLLARYLLGADPAKLAKIYD